MKQTLKTLILALVPLAAMAGSVEDAYFGNKNPTLTPQEKAAMAIANKWKAGNTTDYTAPATGAAGAVVFPFGVKQPSIVCAVLQVCDIALQPGEQINDIRLGDTARWTMDPAISGSGETETTHIILKPLDVDLNTSLAVFTNRRVYHMQLRSHRTQYMPKIAFTYPEDSAAKFRAQRSAEVRERKEKTIPETGEYLGNLDFNYEVSGAASWKPIRVYNDGRKTFIQLPATVTQGEAPSLLVLKREGTLFSDEETAMVNYRLQGDRFIVDQVFDRAILIAGVGSSQDRVTITKGGK